MNTEVTVADLNEKADSPGSTRVSSSRASLPDVSKPSTPRAIARWSDRARETCATRRPRMCLNPIGERQMSKEINHDRRGFFHNAVKHGPVGT